MGMLNATQLEYWIAWLDARFGHADYLQLNKKWKRVRFESAAKEILFDIQEREADLAAAQARERALREALEQTRLYGPHNNGCLSRNDIQCTCYRKKVLDALGGMPDIHPNCTCWWTSFKDSDVIMVGGTDACPVHGLAATPPAPEHKPIGPAMDALREAAGHHFDGVDADAYVRSLRDDDAPLAPEEEHV